MNYIKNGIMQNKKLVYDLCWKYHKLRHKSMKIPLRDRIHEDLPKILNQIIDELDTFHEQKNNFLMSDISSLFNWSPLTYGIYSETKKPFAKITKKDVQKLADKYIFQKPREYEFFFEFGFSSDFPNGYQLGSGIFYSFDKLPKHTRDFILDNMPYEDERLQQPTLSDEDWIKQRKQDAHMQILVKASGDDKAKEKAFSEMKRNYNIFKIIDGIREDRKDNSPFPYSGYDIQQKRGWLNARYVSSFHITKWEFHDKQIEKINRIFNKKNPSELEQRILNAIDVYGLIESDTPLHVKFLLCIIGLESLLLGKDDRDYLGTKIAEKVTFLLSDVHWWLMEIYDITFDESDKITKHFIKKHKINSRLLLHKKIKEFYKKRSGLAHDGLNLKKNITRNDYSWASNFLRWTVEILSEKTNEFTHIAQKSKDDEKCLDLYFQKLKYG